MDTAQPIDPAVITDHVIMQKIYIIRGKRVMLDRDLAVLYNYETKRMNEQVRRNQTRFPASFMFQLALEEIASLRSQTATANISSKSRTLPYAFTEHGVLMLASVLKSEVASKISIHIIETFIKLREMVVMNKDMLLKLERLEKQQSAQDTNIRQLLQHLALFTREQQPRPLIGFQTE